MQTNTYNVGEFWVHYNIVVHTFLVFSVTPTPVLKIMIFFNSQECE